MTRTQAAYLAGLIDGEGSIGIFLSTRKNQSAKAYAVTARVKIGMCDETLVRWSKQVTKTGSVTTWRRKQTRWKQVFVVTWSGYAAGELLRRIRPFLRLKRPQADLLLKWVRISKRWKGKLGGRGRTERCYPDRVWQQAEELGSAIRALNRRGNPPTV